VPVTVPIVERRAGWVAVLLPTTNRKIGWLPDGGGWVSRPLRDQLVLHRRNHELTWIRDGILRASWTVAVGTKTTPTPLGRTFVLARTSVRGEVYAGLDALALGSVPDDPGAVASGLRGAHTGIHSWYQASSFGRSDSNGCIRVPRAGQRALLEDIAPGTAVIVLA
jgi:lipoprotein-anchoring transpeptidase ErfK/SrfK